MNIYIRTGTLDPAYDNGGISFCIIYYRRYEHKVLTHDTHFFQPRKGRYGMSQFDKIQPGSAGTNFPTSSTDGSFADGTIRVIGNDGSIKAFDEEQLRKSITVAMRGLPSSVDLSLITNEVKRTVFDGISTAELSKALIMAAASQIEKDPAYSMLASRLQRRMLLREVFERKWENEQQLELLYRQSFIQGIEYGIEQELFDPRIGEFDLKYLASHLRIGRDFLLDYMGIFTLYGRYFMKNEQKRLETPQAFWMRVSMGLAIEEPEPEKAAVSFYEIMSQLRYLPSTPTLFHSGFKRAQLSSCYLNTTEDDLGHIFKVLGDNAQLAKWAGGLGTDWTNIRGAGSLIKSIKATSQGVIPYLKLANDVVVAITRSGIRRGGSCAYLETWHIDIEDFLDLRRNTGDERRRAHDMNTAVWIPDLFMKRMQEDGKWTLFSPQEVPDLHHVYGREFEKKYLTYEREAKEGKFKLVKEIPAKQLWKKIITRLFETGHPWVTFKDPCNVRSPQDHVGVVHCSNLCTEITLNTSAKETAVCNLGSVNLARHIEDGVLNDTLLEHTVITAVRMLDNVINLNFYPTTEAKNANSNNRPLGLGMMGFQDALYKMDIPFSSPKALTFADEVMEKISYHAIYSSSLLAKQRGAYPTFKGSKWDRGLFPYDTIELLEKERGDAIDVSRDIRLDWPWLKKFVSTHGMRNSNVMAIAPTATISNIAGCFPCIEPIYKNIYVKANVSGEFTVVNSYLVADLKKLGLWNQEMLDLIKYYDGDIGSIESIPASLKEKYKTAFELDPAWLIRLTAARAKWIDQSQSHNIFMKGTSGKKISDVYITAWKCGLKTTYYLRTLGATQVEKSTLGTQFGFTQKREYSNAGSSCGMQPEECESCQ